ncbi:MAG TPA: ZIP family metal transporter [Candidatus Saccharimonadales bacterium]|nr:ZIP family metal transporter [Candidatus Saccharimonadales bacterium]
MQEDTSILYVLLAFGLAVGGGALGAFLGTSHKRLCALISVGAGTLLGVTLFGILPETMKTLKWWELLIALGSGYAVFSVISKYIFHVCPACAASHFDEATTHRFSEIASAMMLALAIHCTVDGLAMAAGHQAEASATPTARVANFSIILAVCVHKIPEGLALGALLRGAGLSPSGILQRVVTVEATTLLGGIIGLLFLPSVSNLWVSIALAHAGGGFIFLAAHAVLGEILKHHKALVLACFGGGVALIGIFAWLLSVFFS